MVDHHAVRELELYADNDSALYAQREPYLKNMARRMKKGTYKPELGVKLWAYYVERAAKKYAHEIAREPKSWARMFPPAVRREVAKHYEEEARRELRGG